LVISLKIPLTNYDGPFSVYEVTALPVKLPNSRLDTILEMEHRFVAIHDSTNHMVVLTAGQAEEVRISEHYLLRYPIIHTYNSCTQAIYMNDAKLTKDLCTYMVHPTATKPWLF